MVPAAVEDTESSETGDVNAPEALLNCATKRLPAVNVPVMVYGMLMVVPGHIEVVIVPVVIVCDITVVNVSNRTVSNK